MGSLFSACKSAVRNNSGGTFNIGGYDIDIEYYGQQDIDDDFTYGDVAFGDADESKILLVAGSTITIPEGYTLIPDSPKKSLVIFCNDLINNGTISMYQKAPNVLPHDYFIIEKTYFDSNKDLVIPAYADNAVSTSHTYNNDNWNGTNGNNGTNRQCGSGGTGMARNNPGGTIIVKSGSGYAFGGGAGSGGFDAQTYSASINVDEIYPMHGSTAIATQGYSRGTGGVGNPSGGHFNAINQNFGCGGRIIIFCNSFNNNGTITVNGTDSIYYDVTNYGLYPFLGGASGAGAIDLFYTTLIKQGMITATGGNFSKNPNQKESPGKGGNGSITLSQWSQTKLFKTEAKYFSQANVAYLLTQLSDRIKESHMGE